MKKYLVEFIGMFLFVLVVGMVVIGSDSKNFMLPVAIGSTLMVLVYAGGHVSGGHYNPAVTLAVWMRGRCSAMDVPIYWISQILGAFAASFVVMYLKGDTRATPAELQTAPALVAEFIGTFALCYVVLNVATAKATAGNSNYGLAIGFTVVVMAYALGGVSGGAFNPAIATGITLLHIEKAANIWIYLAGDFAGAALAALTFKLINPEDK
jgi:aquaporin Z